MKTTNLYRSKEDCCGCELCATKCPRGIIQMLPDEEGFLYPEIMSEDICIDCGKCLSVCPLKDPNPSNNVLDILGGYSNSHDDVKSSSSGGIATLICKNFILLKKGVVYGVAYNKTCDEVVYERATSIPEIEQFRTSKYVQSKKNDVYKHILKDLKNGLNVLFIGLPCDVAAVYKAVGINKSHLFTISLICHGPTSPKVHKEFCDGLVKKYNSNIKSISVRHKKNGWKPYYIYIRFLNNKSYLAKFATSTYDIAFKYLKRPSCTCCEFKIGNHTVGNCSDIILGDFHAVQETDECYNSWGTSEVIILSNKGNELIELVKPYSTLTHISKTNLTRGNSALYSNITIPSRHDKYKQLFVKYGLRKSSQYPPIFLHEKFKYLKRILRDRVRSLLIKMHIYA